MAVNTPGYPPLTPQLTIVVDITITTLAPVATLPPVLLWLPETILTLSKTPTSAQRAGDCQEAPIVVQLLMLLLITIFHTLTMP